MQKQAVVVSALQGEARSRCLEPRIAVIDAEAVISRLEEAGQTLICLPNTGYTTSLRQSRHQHLSEAAEIFGGASDLRAQFPVPSPSSITRMDQALAWISLIPADKLLLRRVVGCRALVSPLTGRHLYTWRRLARLVGADHKAVQRWHASAVDHIVTALAAMQSPLEVA